MNDANNMQDIFVCLLFIYSQTLYRHHSQTLYSHTLEENIFSFVMQLWFFSRLTISRYFKLIPKFSMHCKVQLTFYRQSFRIKNTNLHFYAFRRKSFRSNNIHLIYLRIIFRKVIFWRHEKCIIYSWKCIYIFVKYMYDDIFEYIFE